VALKGLQGRVTKMEDPDMASVATQAAANRRIAIGTAMTLYMTAKHMTRLA
jgi:hypothetical protein